MELSNQEIMEKINEARNFQKLGKLGKIKENQGKLQKIRENKEN